jgi:WD40 repeat protein
VQFSPDSTKLAIGAMSWMRMFETNTWTYSILETDRWFDLISGVPQFSSDGSKLASISRGSRVIVWDLSTGAQLHRLEGHSHKVNAVQFSPDSSKLASASDDKKVMIWNPSTGARLHTLPVNSGAVKAVRFSPDGTKLASASCDGKVLLWNLNKPSLVEKITEEKHISNLEFSPNGSYLKTNTGSFKLKSAVGVSSDESACCFDLQVQENWILRYGQKMIWLPPNFRVFRGVALFSKVTIALGHSSGTVSFWEISA